MLDFSLAATSSFGTPTTTHATERGGISHDQADPEKRQRQLYLSDNASFGLGLMRLYEVTKNLADGALEVEYEVRHGTEVRKFAALGAAYIEAGEMTGTKT